MANRYWVGGTGTWNSSSTTHWSTTSGGSSGATVPTSSDNVFFDSNSFSSSGQIVTLSTTISCLDIDWTGVLHNPVLTGATPGVLSVFGSLTFNKGITFTDIDGNSILKFVATTSGKNITSGGQLFGLYSFGGTNGGYVLQDDAQTTPNGGITGNSTTNLNLNGKLVTCNNINFPSGSTLTMGSSNVAITGSGCFFDVEGNLNANISTLTVTGTDNLSTEYIYITDTHILNNVVLNTSLLIIADTVGGSVSYNSLILATGKTYEFQQPQTYIVNNFNAVGTIGNLITITSDSSGNAFTLSKSSGTVICDYLSLQDSHAIGATFYAGSHSVNVSGNAGWQFKDQYTPVSKPISTSYTNQNTQGKEQYNQPSLMYDDIGIFYDGVFAGAYTSVAKPISTSYSLINKS